MKKASALNRLSNAVRTLAMVRTTGLEYTMEHPAETPGGNSPLDCCIYMGRVCRYSRCGRQDSITLWSTRRKRRMATVHRTVAFTWVRVRRPDTKKESPEGLSFLVRATGLEPARLSQRNLNPPSLPIPPRPRIACNRVILSWEPGNVNGRQPEPLKFPGGKGQFSQFLLSLSLTFRQGACKIS